MTMRERELDLEKRIKRLRRVSGDHILAWAAPVDDRAPDELTPAEQDLLDMAPADRDDHPERLGSGGPDTLMRAE